MNVAVSCDFSKAFEEVKDNSSLKPIDMMKKIIDAIPASAGFKEENGILKPGYPDEKVNTWRPHPLWFDAATLADVACYHLTIHRDGAVEKLIVDADKVIEAVRLIPPDDAVKSFKKICSVALAQRDEIDGRQTDAEEYMNFNKRMDIVAQYKDSLVELNLYAPAKIENQTVLQLDRR